MASGKGTWKKGEKTVTGSWEYVGNDRFFIELDAEHPYLGGKIRFTVVGDDPNFNDWRKVEDPREDPVTGDDSWVHDPDMGDI